MFSSPSHLALIITAAGESSRMGTPKGLVTIDQMPLLQSHVENFRAAFPLATIILVLGHHILPYQHLVNHLQTPQLIIAINEEYHRGHFSSIATGVSVALEHQMDHLFLMPIDLPPLPPSLFQDLYEQRVGHWVVKPRYHRRAGHPIFLQKNVMELIAQSDPLEGRLDLLLRSVPLDKIYWHDCTVAEIGINLNTPQALDAYINTRKIK